ncbi:MAG: Arc/MetJ family transcription regulator [Verrucomicrobiales bacterium]|jgi:Arc/MetJ family transcription regulator
MKYTLNIDDVLLERVVKVTGAATKTEAIHLALREIDRKARLVEVLREGTGAAEEALREMFDPVADPLAMRVAETPETYRIRKKSSPST